MIRLTEVRLDEEAERLVLDVLRSGRLAQGPKVAEFEETFARIAGTAHAVAVSSGTTALVAAIQALDLQPGDEVITTPFTFVATLNAILEAGAVARLVDIDPRDFTIDPECVAEAIGPATRAIMPVHLYGYPADMAKLAALSEAAGVPIIEDAAQAHGASVRGRSVGSWGMGAFSFYATKNVTTGEGGIITTDDDAIAERIRLLRNQGMRARYEYVIPGHNYRMTELQAAVGLSQLPHLGRWTERRRAHADKLRHALSGVVGLDLPSEADGRSHVYHQFTVRIGGEAAVDRDAAAAALLEAGIETGVYYPKLTHDYDCYRNHPQVAVSSVTHAERGRSRGAVIAGASVARTGGHRPCCLRGGRCAGRLNPRCSGSHPTPPEVKWMPQPASSTVDGMTRQSQGSARRSLDACLGRHRDADVGNSRGGHGASGILGHPLGSRYRAVSPPDHDLHRPTPGTVRRRSAGQRGDLRIVRPRRSASARLDVPTRARRLTEQDPAEGR